MAVGKVSSASSADVQAYEKAVDGQLLKAGQRVRMLDSALAGLYLTLGVLFYASIVCAADRVWDLPAALRLILWTVFCLAAGTYCFLVGKRLLLQRVNPHYVARRLESTIPSAKNSVINWLDLRGQPLAPAIRSALGRRAANDLDQADPAEAVSGRRLWWPAGSVGLLLLFQLAWLAAAPGQVWSLWQRAFFPFDTARIAARTELKLIQPASGNVVVGLNQPVAFRVEASGNVPVLNRPDSLKLLFRYHQNEPFEERPLLRDLDDAWTTTVHADQVRNGFWYKITGGDSQLPEAGEGEYHVTVRSNPQILSFLMVFKYRDYLGWPDKTVKFDKNVRPSMRELRGTEVTLTVRANRALGDCKLELKTAGAAKRLSGSAVDGDPESWRFTWVLDRSGEFRILFQSKDGEDNIDREPCKIVVIPDRPPEVTMTQPAKDVTLPPGGTLVVEGSATDDFGVRSMQLSLKLLKAPTMPELQAKPYREDKSFKLDNGKYPLRLTYSDFLALETIRTLQGEAFPLAPGMELEYWLEALDNCDYPVPTGNRGQSAHFKLTIGEPQKDQSKLAEARKGAQQQTQQGQSRQDGDWADQNLQAKAEQEATDPNQKEKIDQDRNDLAKKADQVEKAINKDQSKGSAKGADQPQGDAEKSQEQGQKNGVDGGGKSPQPKGQDDNGGADKSNQTGGAKDQGAAGSGQPPPGKTKNDGSRDDQSGQAKTGPEDPKNDAGAGAKEKGPQQDGPKTKDAGGAGNDSAKGGKKDNGGDAGSAKAGGQDINPTGADAAKGETKKGPTGEPPQAKGSDGTGDKSEAGQPKGLGDQGDPKTRQQGAGDKTGTADNQKSSAKTAPPDMEKTQGAKGADGAKGPPRADAKLAPPDASQKAAGEAKPGDRKNATIDDVSQLQEELADPARRQDAVKGLEKIADQATESNVSQAAQKALQKAEQDNRAAKSAETQNPPAGQSADKATPAEANGKDGQSASAKGNPSPSSAPNQNKDGDDAAKNANAGGKTNPRKSDSGTSGLDKSGGSGQEMLPPDDPSLKGDQRREGDLQLETLKKQIEKLRDQLTPKVMKDLNWTDKDKEQFLQSMMKDALLRQEMQKAKGEKLPPPGSNQSLLPATGPRLLREPGNNSGNNVADRPEAPPEVREAQSIFNGNPGVKGKN
jgi:hypothetical protein